MRSLDTNRCRGPCPNTTGNVAQLSSHSLFPHAADGRTFIRLGSLLLKTKEPNLGPVNGSFYTDMYIPEKSNVCWFVQNSRGNSEFATTELSSRSESHYLFEQHSGVEILLDDDGRDDGGGGLWGTPLFSVRPSDLPLFVRPISQQPVQWPWTVSTMSIASSPDRGRHQGMGGVRRWG